MADGDRLRPKAPRLLTLFSSPGAIGEDAATGSSWPTPAHRGGVPAPPVSGRSSSAKDTAGRLVRAALGPWSSSGGLLLPPDFPPAGDHHKPVSSRRALTVTGSARVCRSGGGERDLSPRSTLQPCNTSPTGRNDTDSGSCSPSCNRPVVPCGPPGSEESPDGPRRRRREAALLSRACYELGLYLRGPMARWG